MILYWHGWSWVLERGKMAMKVPFETRGGIFDVLVKNPPFIARSDCVKECSQLLPFSPTLELDRLVPPKIDRHF